MARDLPTDDVGDMQPRQGKVVDDLLENDVRGVVRADIEVGTGIGNSLHSLGQVFRYDRVVVVLPAGHAPTQWNRADDDGWMHVRAEVSASLVAGSEKA